MAHLGEGDPSQLNMSIVSQRGAQLHTTSEKAMRTFSSDDIFNRDDLVTIAQNLERKGHWTVNYILTHSFMNLMPCLMAQTLGTFKFKSV